MILPIQKYKEEIIEAVRSHSFTIINAETGSGKSTQVPQYLADYYSQIVITEPRIVATKTLAKFVSEEMEVVLGQEVGYNTAYDKCYSSRSKILYCTDGLQVVKTLFQENDDEEKVLILDEAHEWNLNMEILLAWCKSMQGKWRTKVVIMSATIDTANLSAFLGDYVSILNIPGRLYDVEMQERPAFELIDTIREYINQKKNILVFVAGKKEISDVIEELYYEDATVLPLHSELEWEEQKKCFDQYANSKVIVATNIAQTSLTIPDIEVVVDSGEARISIAENGIQGLFLKNISQSDIIQRRGRAGRTRDGKYILCSNVPFESRSEFTIPEIQRSILDRVVLQLAAIGLNAEELEFYHQPERKSILEAKKELIAIGALSNNKVTESGYKMVKMPISVQFARMIVEAEKYGVVEQVMTITAIIEMGGLLDKDGYYARFTTETKSDLLAELDTWNSIKMKYIEFKKLGIKKKNYFRIKQHIQKLRQVLDGVVEMSHNDDREAVVKSCLSGLVSHIYIRDVDEFYGNDGTIVQLDRKSCVSCYAGIVVGIPKTIEFKDKWNCITSLDLVSFATKIDVKTLFELVPNQIEEETKLIYSKSEDAVEVTTNKIYAGLIVDNDVRIDYSHPQYSVLKKEYDDMMKQSNFAFEPSTAMERQEYVFINGKKFKIYYGWDNSATIYMDAQTLFTTEIKELTLDSGTKVQFGYEVLGRKETNLVALRNAVEMKRLKRIRDLKKYEYESINVNTIHDVIANFDKIGPIELTHDNGGYGDTPILVYGCIWLSKNTVKFKFEDDKELADSNTLTALQYLFTKEVERRYGESKFSHQTGKKKKTLTEAEKDVKKDFDSLVRELLLNLTIENTVESLEFLEEYFQEVMQ